MSNYTTLHDTLVLRNVPSAIHAWRSSSPEDSFAKWAMASFSLLEWLSAQTQQEKFYWASRDGSEEIAVVGFSKQLSGDSHRDVAQIISDHYEGALAPDHYIYGAMSFDDASTDDTDWEFSKSYQLFWPSIECRRVGNQYTMYCWDLASSLETVVWEVNPLHMPPVSMASSELYPLYGHWNEMVQFALDRIQSGDIEKVALSRRLVIGLSESIDPMAVIQHLSKINPNCTAFAYQNQTDEIFLGASPEQLFSRKERHITTDAIAGTVPTNSGVELLHDQKMLAEHHQVVLFLQDQLATLCESYTESELGILHLAYIKHLHAQFDGVLKDDVTDGDILMRLHPTPAVGGTPQDRAKSIIRDCEPHNRGVYTGVVGRFSPSCGEGVVAIRSGVLSSQTLSIYSGVGIVDGADSKEEWDELDNKLLPFLSLFDHQ